MQQNAEAEGGFGFNPFGYAFGGSRATQDLRTFEQILREYEDFFKMESEKQTSTNEDGTIKGRDVYETLQLDFLEAVNGCKKTVNVARYIKCDNCHGEKFAPDAPVIICPACDGKGFVKEEYGG